MGYRSFSELDDYKECRKFRKMVAETVAKCFPPIEKFLLTAQILDSSRSITANLAEGHGRYYYKDSIKFCRYSSGFLEETLEHLITAFDEKHISAEMLKSHKVQYDKCLQLINGFIRYLNKTKRGNDDAPPPP